ncbi:D-alanyl-D-alanine carboxypeptidase family protein [Streptomyces candidus]|uniref:D-alanyl-D-alanine carboxypeptidase (Penicillin-binding protein 5/6) n=1 Tax=Streptomyces candidus TaxID=67283 RepID=A0A7X0HG22_9ACTN|nr:D-alanyl-D-alanine carboxypeptidase [Streptomyces candidus]MBB6436788.1 D-alanyl-D-alanine carboxypeptidase (penicillin-binding protein 5/6) [Streptomyces candidus]
MRPFTSPSLRHALAVLAAAAATAVTAVTAVAGAPAMAAGGNDAARTPPAQMSTAGGELLGRPGPQVGAGAPALPHGISALSWIVSDADTGQVLGASNAHWALPPASTLKMLFADTVLPVVPHGTRHRVTEDELRGMGAGSSAVGIVPGQQYEAADLWRGVFLRSGNDAVHVLAALNGGVPKTVADMQRRAEELGARDTQVRSPDGYDTPGQVSSAYDLALFLRAGLKNAEFREYCSTADADFPGGPGTKGKPFGISNTNRMLSGIGGVAKYPGLIGGKNGYTTNAGNTLAEAARRDGHTLLVTVMNPQTHRHDHVYTEMRSLLDWGFSAVGRAAPVGSLDPVAPVPAASPSAGVAGGTSAVGPSSAPLGALGWTGAGASAVVAGGAVLLVARRRGSGTAGAGHGGALAARRAGAGRRRRG